MLINKVENHFVEVNKMMIKKTEKKPKNKLNK
jgi:hypothetical protein